MSSMPDPLSDPVGQHSPTPVNQPDNTPTAKVTAGLLAGSVAAVLVSLAKSVGIELEPELAASVVTLVFGLAAYFKRSRPGEVDL